MIIRKKLVSVEDAAAVIKSNDRVFFAPVCSAPVDVVNAINKKKDELTNVEMFQPFFCILLNILNQNSRPYPT